MMYDMVIVNNECDSLNVFRYHDLEGEKINQVKNLFKRTILDTVLEIDEVPEYLSVDVGVSEETLLTGYIQYNNYHIEFTLFGYNEHSDYLPIEDIPMINMMDTFSLMSEDVITYSDNDENEDDNEVINNKEIFNNYLDTLLKPIE